MEKTPVIILTGFLGAGKTTVLNQLLRHSNGKRIGVVVNDFGDVNIDALLVGKQTSDSVELSGGCICCEMSEGGLDDTLDSFVHPGSMLDAVVIEASGIAEPSDVKKLVLYSRNKNIELGGVVYVVDTVNIENLTKKHPEIINHIAAADLIVLTKTDIATKTQVEKARALCREHNAQATVIEADNGAIPPELFFDTAQSTGEQMNLAQLHDTDHQHHLHENFNSISFTTEKPLDPQKFEKFLKQLPAHIYRVKGIVYYGLKGFEQKFIIHAVGAHHTITTEEWHGWETPSSTIVAIGVDCDEDLIRKQLENCIDTSPDDVHAGTMVDILRYKGL